jgi:hypothetical protein
MEWELATESLKGATFSLNENREHPFLPYGIFAEHNNLSNHRSSTFVRGVAV